MQPFTSDRFFSIRARMSWNNGANRNFFLQLKSKLGFLHVVLTTSKTSPEKPTLFAVEIQQSPDNGKTDSKEEITCLHWKNLNGRTKARVSFKTDSDKLNFVLYR